MIIKSTSSSNIISANEITDQQQYLDRRAWIKQQGTRLAGLGLMLSGMASSNSHAGFFSFGADADPSKGAAALPKFAQVKSSAYSLLGKDDALTPLQRITTYGNFYEFGPDKSSPGENAHNLRTSPWSISIEGAVKKNKRFSYEDILKMAPLEERIYRMRCVEGWSMVVPWVGIPLSALIAQAGITGNAKFVEFYSLADKEQMPYVNVPFLDWPYMEAIRLDEAMHPLTILAVGMYGAAMPKPNGAPLRLVIPWKYGFKSAKSIIKIRFVERQPETIWTKTAPDEYGFYANVNPNVPHKRWSQRNERRLGDFLQRKTLMFNGYADQVAQLYTGMNLSTNF